MGAFLIFDRFFGIFGVYFSEFGPTFHSNRGIIAQMSKVKCISNVLVCVLDGLFNSFSLILKAAMLKGRHSSQLKISNLNILSR